MAPPENSPALQLYRWSELFEAAPVGKPVSGVGTAPPCVY